MYSQIIILLKTWVGLSEQQKFVFRTDIKPLAFELLYMLVAGIDTLDHGEWVKANQQ